jgi:ATP-binding cassette, subfamily F, member 3
MILNIRTFKLSNYHTLQTLTKKPIFATLILPMISINNLSVHFTGTYIFENVSFLVNDRDRVGLVGKNGAGKTTLLRIIAGLMEPETGTVTSPSGSTIGYLPQEMATGSLKNVMNETLEAFSEAIELKKQIDRFTQDLANRTDFESEGYYKLITKLNESNDRFHIIGGHHMQEEAEKVLSGLGFQPDEFERPVATFSGGWQMRIELAKILLRQPDVVLLDEPTNHLDIESIQWLEDFLCNYRGAVILVSHDRAFLDNVTNRTIEISLGKIYDYKASYSDYVLLREEQIELQMASFTNQQRQIEQIERFIEKFRYKATKSRQVQSRIKMLDKIDRIDIDEMDSSAIHFRFPPAPRSGKVVVEAHNLTKSYGEKLVLKGLEFAIIKNDFVAFVGRNGEGKTTLARMIIGQLQYEGKLTLGHNVEIGYYAQNQAELLDPEKTVFQTIDDVATGDLRPKVRNILGSFLFGGETIDKKVKVLSGGEKSRLALARLLLKPVSLLVLDEPTNHLDMVSKDILKNALLKFDGTLIVVSHDRDFLQGLTTKVFEFRNHIIKQHIGDVYDYLETRKLHSLKQLEVKKTTSNMRVEAELASDNKATYERRKQQEREIRKVAQAVTKSEEAISHLEDDIKRYDQMLANPEAHKQRIASGDLYREYEQIKHALEKEMENWAKLHEQLDQMNANKE